MKRDYIKRVDVENKEEKTSFTLDYYITEDYYPMSKKIKIIMYGVGVRKKEKSFQERKEARGIFSSLSDAMEFLCLTARNAVTPVSFDAIAEDFIKEKKEKEPLHF